MMMDLILEIILKIAAILPTVLSDVTGAITKVESDTTLAERARTVLTSLSQLLDDVVKAL